MLTLDSNLKEYVESISKFPINRENSNKFNFAIITKTEEGVNYKEFWILSNAYYNYENERFVKIDGEKTSFAIQIQADGSYPGEAEIGYTDNQSIGLWRNPPKNQWTSQEHGDYIGLNISGAWKEFGIIDGWLNNVMTDSYGGLTVGGAGFEIDGNGIFPYTRVTSCKFQDSTGIHYVLGLLWNAYHMTLNGGGSDDPYQASWFFGLLTDEIDDDSENMADMSKTRFVIMKNESDSYETLDDFDMDKWEIIFTVNTDGTIESSTITDISDDLEQNISLAQYLNGLVYNQSLILNGFKTVEMEVETKTGSTETYYLLKNDTPIE